MILTQLLLTVIVALTTTPTSSYHLTGRTLFHPESLTHSFDQPGVWIDVIATTTPTTLTLSKASGSRQVDYFITYCDGVRQTKVINTSSWPNDNTTIDIQIKCPPGNQNIRFFKTTEAQWNSLVPMDNAITLHGVSNNDTSQDLEATAPSTKRIEFLGDSITAGFCNLCESNPTNTAATESYADSWSNRICQTFRAECHTAAWSGYGMVENCCGGATLMSDIWKRTLASVPSTNKTDVHGTMLQNEWNFSSWSPDVVVINLGTNDELNNRNANIPKFNETYMALIQDASAMYGEDTHFFLACGPMSTAYCDNVQWIVQTLTKTTTIKTHFLDQRGFLNGTYGKACCGHPSATVDIAMANAGVAVIAKEMGMCVVLLRIVCLLVVFERRDIDGVPRFLFLIFIKISLFFCSFCKKSC